MHPIVSITSAHWVYLIGVLAIVATMILRANVVVPAVLATFAVAYVYSGKLLIGLQAIFEGSLTAANELFNIFLVIALMTALLNSLRALGADVRMVKPFKRIMVNGHVGFFVLTVVTYLISLFFWPTPAVPLVGAILIPAAIYAGLPPLGAAMAIAIAGQGMALSSDYVIKVAPGISAKAAGAPMLDVANMALLLSIITGLVALGLTYIFYIRRQVIAPAALNLHAWEAIDRSRSLDESTAHSGTFAKAELARATSGGWEMPMQMSQALVGSPTVVSGGGLSGPEGINSSATDREKKMVFWSKTFSIITPLAFALIVVLMTKPALMGADAIRGGDAAALIGGIAMILMMCATLSNSRREFLNQSADHIIDGFVFAFKAMGAVLPIAGFFFVGDSSTAGPILGIGSGSHVPSFLFEMVQSVSQYIPHSPLFVSFGVLIMGMITGIDGSGFAGLPLTGALSGALAPLVHMPSATLAAIGQMGAVWTGGGTLVAWSSLIAVAGFARVPVLDAVRALFFPVVCGLIVSTVVAVVIS